MIASNGRVKLLDFGLAKDIATTPMSEAAEAPTFSRETGVALGTAPYMSPEQTRGQPVDERTDIWAFGCVMYEVLTGKRAFQGATLPDTVANILEREPDWSAINSATPPALSKLIETSVSKNAADRPRRCEDIIEVLRQSHARRTDGVSSSTRLMIGIGLFAVVILAWITLRSSPEDFTFSNARQLTSGIGVQDLPDWSPDGRMLAYHSNRAGNTDIWIMQADGSNSLNRTADHGGDDMFPVWSPDGTQIAFFSARDSGGIFIMEPLAGVPRRISRKGDVARGVRNGLETSVASPTK